MQSFIVNTTLDLAQNLPSSSPSSETPKKPSRNRTNTSQGTSSTIKHLQKNAQKCIETDYIKKNISK